MKKIFGFLTLAILLFSASFTSACQHCGNQDHTLPEMFAVNHFETGHIPREQHDRRSVPVVGVLKFANMSGDMRLRYDTGRDQVNINNQLFRIRMGMEMIINDNMYAEFRLTSDDCNAFGYSGIRFIGFDRANAKYQYIYNGHTVLLTGGKMGSPFLRPNGTELMFDRDSVALEGVGVNYINNDYDIFVSAGYFKNMISGVQTGISLDKLPDMNIILSVGAYEYTEVEDGPNAYEALVECAIPKMIRMPVILSGHYVVTTDSDEAWTTNIQLGQCTEPWEKELNFAYHSVDPGAVQPWLSDRDYHTADGYEIGFKTKIFKNVVASTRYITHNFDDIWRVKSDLTLEF